MKMYVIVLCIFLFSAECKEALGMHSGAIPDFAITASSAYDIKSVGPLNARYVSNRFSSKVIIMGLL